MLMDKKESVVEPVDKWGNRQSRPGLLRFQGTHF